jgi:hypothetical protein
MKLDWHNLGVGQPLACEVGDITLYKFPDGHASCAVGGSLVSALFESPEAALSWDGAWDEAEERFKQLNLPSGKGPNRVSTRS